MKGLRVFLLAVSTAMAGTPSFTLINPTNAEVAGQAITFGYVFAPGDVPAGKTLTAGYPLQVDAKARHPDGSLRHAVITVTGTLAAKTEARIDMTQTNPTSGTPVALEDLWATAYQATVTVSIDGKIYTASAKQALQSGTGVDWLSGPLVSEWLVKAPFIGPVDDVHPHLSARFEVRAYAGMKVVRTGVTIENDWAFEPSPSGFTYDVAIQIAGQTVYSQSGVQHAHHARWRKVLWWGSAPVLEEKPEVDYLLATGAVPFYDRSVQVSASALSSMEPGFDLMSNGNLTEYMPETGAHDDIGPLPRFGALYVLSGDSRAKANVLANGMCGGSYSIHYRDKQKDLPVSLDDYPYMTLLGNPGDAQNPKTGKSEAFPKVTAGLDTLTPDDAHQPSIAYLPYLISGDYFYLEELQLWANYNMVMGNPGYRDQAKGLLKWGQVRAQAWSLRTLAEAAYITPDNHPLKGYFVEKVHNNLDWYSQYYLSGTKANALGWLEQNATVYEPYGIAPWQDNFFTWSLGHVVSLGFTEARPLLAWKAKFVVGLLADPGFCWLNASSYSVQVGPADKSQTYATFGELYQANYPKGTCAGSAMDGYPEIATGYGANMQPALAAAVESGIPSADLAWAKYQTRNPKQDYSEAPQFAVVPRLGAVNAIEPGKGAGTRASGPKARLYFNPQEGRLRIQWRDGAESRSFDLRGNLIKAP